MAASVPPRAPARKRVGLRHESPWADAHSRIPPTWRRRHGLANCGHPWPAIVELRTYLVEDNPTIRENLLGTLAELAEVQALGWADTEADARGWLRDHAADWDLVIVDVFLRQGSGLGVLGACHGRAAPQRVVVLTNYATADMRQRCTLLGADAVFDKSNEIDALVDYCRSLQVAPASRSAGSSAHSR